MNVLHEIKEGYVTLILNRPEKRNALNTELVRDLKNALTYHAAEQQAKAIIISGAAPAFCAGSDLTDLAGLSAEDMAKREDDHGDLIRFMLSFELPLIAAVEGFALGGGMSLAATCDLVVTCANCRWSMPEVPNGWIPPWGVTAIYHRAGHFKTQQLLMGQPVIGQKALDIGLADVVVDDGCALQEAERQASEIVKLPAQALKLNKRFFGEKIIQEAEQDDRRLRGFFVRSATSPQAQQLLKKYERTE